MAEETKNTYRYIDTDMDRDLLVKNLNHNVQDYVKHKGWDSSKASEFYDALNTYMDALNEGRLSTSRSGSLLDSAGILDNGSARWRDKNGNVISQADYDAMKKRKRKNLTNDFYPHREVAGYFNTVAKAFYDAKYNPDNQKKEEEKPAEKFDLGTHGLWNQFVLSLNPSGEGDLQTWMNMDEWNPTEKTRPTTERAKYLGQFIDTYLSKLPENQDFSNYNFTRQEYADLARELQQELQDGATNVDFRLLERLGANPASYQAYFSTAEKPNVEQPAASVDENGLSDEDKENLNNIFNYYKKQAKDRNYTSYRYTGKEADIGGKTDEERLQNYKDYLNKNNIDLSKEALQNMDTKKAAAYLPLYYEFAEENTFQPITLGDYQGWEFIPGSFNNKYHSVLAYNPTTKTTRRIWYGDIGDAVDDYNNILIKNYKYNRRQNQPRFQQGGLIELSANAIDKFNSDLKKRSVETKSNPKLRQPWKEDNNYSENELTKIDIARLSAIGADIAALIDPEPVSAPGLGLASDITNLVADVKEGYGFWNTAGNFVGNVGLSAIGMIPIFGDAVGSGGKIVKSLIKLAPKVTKTLMVSGAIATLTNGDEILKSINKIGKSGPENEMNMEDWRNIGAAIQLILGGANAVKNAKTVSKLRAKGKTDMLDVVCKDKATGEKKVFRFGDKEDIEALKNAKTPEDVNKVINSHNSFKGKYEVATQEGKNVTYFGEDSKLYKPWTWKSTTKTTNLHPDAIREAIDYNKIRATAKKGTLSRSEYIARNGTPGYNPGRTPEIITRGNRTTAANANRAGQRALPFPEERLGLPLLERGNVPVNQPITPNTVAAQANMPAGQAAIGYNPSSNLPPINRILTPQQEMQFRLNAATPAAPERSLLGRGVANAPHQKVDDLVRGARAYRQTQGSIFNPNTTPHSLFGNRLMQNGASEAYLLSIGAWMKGGKLIPKGQAGLYTTNFTSGVPYNIFEVSPQKFNFNRSLIQESRFGSLPLDTSAKSSGKNYGEGYESTLDYANKEYGVEGPVNLSAIQKANAEKRDIPNLKPIHGAKDYDYTNAQANTDRARAMWQSDANNRINDFKSWAKNWYTTHQNGTQAQMLADYNNAIDSMYRYKHEMGTDAYSGEGSYRHGDEVTKFNRTNRDIYGSANSANGVHGYSSEQESWNGTTTAQRFIDITDTDINDFDWNFDEDEDENFKNLFTGLVKDTTGRYYVQDPDISAYQSKTDVIKLKPQTPTMPYASAVKETEIPEEGGEGGQTDKASKFNNLTGILADMGANSIAVGRYLAARNLNRRLLNIAKEMPTLLYQPMEAQRWVRGDQNAIQQGYQAAGQLGHLASQPITANGAEQMATMLEARDRGQNYINQGYNQNDQVANATTEAVWNQARANQQSRYDSSTKNKENLFSTRVNYLTSLGQKYRADQESLNSLLSQWETQLRENDAANKAYREAVAKASLQNQITANLAANGIDATPEDQKMFNDLMTGKKQLDDLTPEETASYNRISNAISEQVTKKMALSKGAVYTPFTPNSAYNTDNWEVSIPYKRKGGLLAPDSEKITIQKLRGSIQKMLARQRHFEARLNAFEKDMDRSHKGADSYIKGQKKSK